MGVTEKTLEPGTDGPRGPRRVGSPHGPYVRGTHARTGGVRSSQTPRFRGSVRGVLSSTWVPLVPRVPTGTYEGGGFDGRTSLPTGPTGRVFHTERRGWGQGRAGKSFEGRFTDSRGEVLEPRVRGGAPSEKVENTVVVGRRERVWVGPGVEGFYGGFTGV